MLRKDVLSPEEIQKLIACHYDNENPTIRRAFIFCLYCGLRFCDVKDLTYRNVDYANRLLKFEQSKTKGHSASSGVVIPLGKESRNRQTYKLALCPPFFCREHSKQWGKYQDRSQSFRTQRIEAYREIHPCRG